MRLSHESGSVLDRRSASKAPLSKSFHFRTKLSFIMDKKEFFLTTFLRWLSFNDNFCMKVVIDNSFDLCSSPYLPQNNKRDELTAF